MSQYVDKDFLKEQLERDLSNHSSELVKFGIKQAIKILEITDTEIFVAEEISDRKILAEAKRKSYSDESSIGGLSGDEFGY